LFAIVHGDLSGDVEATHDILPEELLEGSGRGVLERLGFDPFGEYSTATTAYL